MRRQYIQIKDSYTTWLPRTMREEIKRCVPNCYEKFSLLILEWWLHNLVYWATLPFIHINNFFTQVNLRCRDVDLMVPIHKE